MQPEATPYKYFMLINPSSYKDQSYRLTLGLGSELATHNFSTGDQDPPSEPTGLCHPFPC